MNTKTRKIVLSAMFAALACVATMVIKIASPLGGYINLGDCIVLLAGWMLSPVYGLIAAGLGSAFADILSGYVAYAPITFVTKALMAVSAFYVFKLLNKKIANTASRIISGAVAEIIMVALYYVFEGIFMYGFGAAAVNIPVNALQGAAGLVIGVLLSKVFEKYKIVESYNN